jgi:hypothetical protein
MLRYDVLAASKADLMRLVCLRLLTGLLLASMVSGCHGDVGHQQGKSSKSSVRPLATPVPKKLDPKERIAAGTEAEHGKAAPRSEPIVVRAEYHAGRRCVRMADSAFALVQTDSFTVVPVIRGRLKAKSIDVRLFSSRGPSYPKGLAEGVALTLRLNFSDETLRQVEECEQKNSSEITVNGEEVEQMEK